MSTPHPEPPEGRHRRPRWWTDPKARLYLYGVGIAALPVLVAYGLLSEDQAPLWAAFLGGLLAIAPPATAAGTLARQLATGQLPRHDDDG